MRATYPLVSVLALSGCVAHVQTGPPRHESIALDRGDATVARVYLTMKAGQMRVDSGAGDKLARASFDYNVPAWKPEVRYNSGTLHITQPSLGGLQLGDNRYEWDLALTRDLPVELNVNFGAGQADLNLGALDLRRIDVQMGVGQINLDLRGQPKRSYSVRVKGGVGEAVLRLPSDVGIIADARGGIGEISAPGLMHDGSRYRNAAYGNAPVTIRLDVEGGIGSIKLLTD